VGAVFHGLLGLLPSLTNAPNLFALFIFQLAVTVDSGTDEKAKIGVGTGFKSYPVDTWSLTSEYEKVVIEYSQDCLGLPVCTTPTVEFSQPLPNDVQAVQVGGKITLTGNYTSINQAMGNLILKPGAKNPNTVNVKITASVYDDELDTTVTSFDSFTIPVVSVSWFILKGCDPCLVFPCFPHFCVLTTFVCDWLAIVCSLVLL